MYNMYVRNVNEAWATFCMLACNDGGTGLFAEVAPRGIRTLEVREPFATTYTNPEECVLTDPVRDANPFFHLYEAYWILCGFNDVDRLAWYNAQIREYSDDGETFHGAYGYRARYFTTTAPRYEVDQIQYVIDLLKADPDSRRAVISLWNPSMDAVGIGGKDYPCNAMLFFKIREGALNLTVCNRSNDAVWGCYGANAVQFSILLQYIARKLKVPVGRYTQVSDSLHVYLDGKAGEVWERCRQSPPPLLNEYTPPVGVYPKMILDSANFDRDLGILLSDERGYPTRSGSFREPFIEYVAFPLFTAWQLYKEQGAKRALEYLELQQVFHTPVAYQHAAWMTSGIAWLRRRNNAKKGAK